MKRWAVIVTLAYAMLWLVLAYPVTWVLVEFDWWHLETTDGKVAFSDLFEEPGFWMLFVIVVLCQMALLLVPIGAASEKPKAKRGIIWPALAVTFLSANLLFWGGASLAVLALDFDTVFAPAEFAGDSFQQVMENGLFSRLTGVPIALGSGWYFVGGVLFLISIVWLVWGGIFYRYYMKAQNEDMIRLWLKRLLRGSVLELLVALPTHILMRSKEDCCAPAVSFMGIVTGLSVMLMCFGPGVLFLYLDRAKRLQPRKSSAEPPVDGVPSQS